MTTTKKCTQCGEPFRSTGDSDTICRSCWEYHLRRLGWMRGGVIYDHRDPKTDINHDWPQKRRIKP